ncbi:MAG: DUF4931 domain-containing protein [Candidatus Woesearchaeota archaeon]|nr:MAG: DUF4931 domain-containing protein [Candidatus Woesearchaeota archaeon]
MGELRKDYVEDQFVVINTTRSKRPEQFLKKSSVPEKQGTCFFCPGNESMTPPTITSFDKDGRWQLRVFENKFPIVSRDQDKIIQTHNEFYTFGGSYGVHEIIVETPDHEKQWWDFSPEHLGLIMEMYKKRIQALSEVDNIKFVAAFKNHKAEAGASLPHSHSQIVAFDRIPFRIEHIIEKVSQRGACPYCDIIARERNSHRRLFETMNFIAFAPYASRFAFEVWILPKSHKVSFVEEANTHELGLLLSRVTRKLKEINAPFNMVLVHSLDTSDELHYRLEILPRLNTWAGFEYTGTIVNPMPPEDAAAWYRGQ